MPLARILTRFPEQAGALSQELRQHGYTVEFSSPELTGRPPADLEIDFEICAEPDALSRAAALADQFHADVAISPGVLHQQEVRHETEPAIAPESLPEPVEPPVSFQSETEPVSRQAEDPVWEPEPVQEVSETALPDETAHRNVIPIRSQSVELPQPPMETPVDGELDAAQAAMPEGAQEGDSREETATELMARMGAKSATLLNAAGVAGREAWGSANDRAHEFLLAAQRLGQEARERLNVRREELKAQHQQKLLDLEKRRVLAQERAAELEAAREAAAMRLQELLRERGGLTEAQPAPPQTVVPSAPPASAAIPARSEWLRRIRIPLPSTQTPQMQAVITGVAAACLLFVVGMAVASFHRRPAISNTIQPPNTAQPAYKGVTIQSGGVTVKAGARPAVTTSAARPSPAARAEVAKPAPTQPSRTSDVTIRNFPAVRKPNPARRGNSEHIGDDVTIRHFRAQMNGPARSAPRAELKHYSDLN